MILPAKAKDAINDAVATVKEAADKTSGFVMAAIGIAVAALVVAAVALVVGMRAHRASA